jgi:CRP/FNR family transcriptional regulator, cyclic AMP receptor protein
MRKVLSLLGQLSDDDVDWMAGAGRRRDAGAGEVLIHEGIPIGSVLVMLQGTASVTLPGGREVARIGAGEVLGEMSMIDNRPPSATVSAVESTVVLELGRVALDAKLAADTGFAARFYRALAVFLADRVRNTNAQLGYGKEGASRTLAEEDELDEAVLDNLHLAGARFEAIIARLAGGALPKAA